jgi:hypothetical protein
MRYALLLIYALVAFSSTAADQGQRCDIEVPLNVVTPDAALVRNIPQNGFAAHDRRDSIVIRSVTTDAAPRRVMIVVENGWKVTSAARKIESSILSVLLKNVRPEDSFAFLTAVGPRKEVPFDAPRELLLSAIEELATPARGNGQQKSTLDTVIEAADSLRPFRSGDSVILFSMGIKPDESAYSKARKTLATNGVRLFGFQLGTVYAGTYVRGFISDPRYGRLPTASIDPNRETLFDLAGETGGFFLEEDTENSLRTYDLTDERLKELDELGGQLYKGIVEFYRIQLVAAPEKFVIDLTNPVRQRVTGAVLVYPRHTPRCSP